MPRTTPVSVMERFYSLFTSTFIWFQPKQCLLCQSFHPSFSSGGTTFRGSRGQTPTIQFQGNVWEALSQLHWRFRSLQDAGDSSDHWRRHWFVYLSENVSTDRIFYNIFSYCLSLRPDGTASSQRCPCLRGSRYRIIIFVSRPRTTIPSRWRTPRRTRFQGQLHLRLAPSRLLPPWLGAVPVPPPNHWRRCRPAFSARDVWRSLLP